MRNGLFGWRKKIPNGERMGMEEALGEVLQPIAPRPQFVDGLRRTLMNYTMIENVDETKMNQQNIIVILAGFVSAALLLSIGIRAILTFIAAIGVLNYHKRQIQGNRVSASLKQAS